ncbi:Putative protein involved in ER to Golgi transport [Komagataella phaffii CBS 7435]|uniref:PRA1 family protein n=2 Tax=Komagataella phaffii TaxID=460519 RepID=C4R0U0_KOMPG|nr:uncharacterized protein PAS_chr2-1_0484 [Komagataella phaffii GS115]CAH2448366.1 Yip3-like potein [Komagataella phaffii CBS 7435]CAY69114.1 Protein localized to COPII vesicles, proposed to be involved in ER to Golgi transport [Komagataella phaffii GS115]CCA38494.1 Putative protein involved in ER to Golgi transport [Komagataella phaffii CBS 7435]
MSMSQFANFQFSQLSENMSVDRVRQEAQNISNKFANMKPPQEFFDFRRVSKPANFGEVQQRVAYNLGYFQANYIAIVALLSTYSLLTNLLLLFVIVFTIAGVYGIAALQGQELELGFTRLNTSQLYTGLFIVAVPLGFLASPISTLLWLIGASSVTVLSHASLMEKPIETVFEEAV